MVARLVFRLWAWLWCRDIDRAARQARRARLRADRDVWRSLPPKVRRWLETL